MIIIKTELVASFSSQRRDTDGTVLVSIFRSQLWPSLESPKVCIWVRVFPHESSSLLYDTKLVMYHATSFQHRTGWSASKECVCASLLLSALPLAGNKSSKYFREAASQAGNSSSWQTESPNKADYHRKCSQLKRSIQQQI